LNSKQELAISKNSVVRILFVDDFAPWRHLVIAKLRDNCGLRIVGVVADGLDAIQKARELQPDLILLDIGLPKIGGIAVTRRLLNVAPNSKILFVSRDLELGTAQVALNEGGHGYVVNSDADKELFAAIEAVMMGKRFLSSRLVSQASEDEGDSRGTGQLCKATISPATLLLLKKKVGRYHEADFYSDDSLFLDRFTRFVGAALKDGSVAIFVGTTSHKISLLERLHAESPENRAAIQQGRYIALNAAEFLSTFMVSDMPDTDRFMKTVDDLISTARQRRNGGHLRVAACGECAHTLWAQGNADAAIRLEELWNEIARTYNVDVLCGYSLKGFPCEESTYTVRRICNEHSAIHSW